MHNCKTREFYCPFLRIKLTSIFCMKSYTRVYLLINSSARNFSRNSTRNFCPTREQWVKLTISLSLCVCIRAFLPYFLQLFTIPYRTTCSWNWSWPLLIRRAIGTAMFWTQKRKKRSKIGFEILQSAFPISSLLKVANFN